MAKLSQDVAKKHNRHLAEILGESEIGKHIYFKNMDCTIADLPKVVPHHTKEDAVYAIADELDNFNCLTVRYTEDPKTPFEKAARKELASISKEQPAWASPRTFVIDFNRPDNTCERFIKLLVEERIQLSAIGINEQLAKVQNTRNQAVDHVKKMVAGIHQEFGIDLKMAPINMTLPPIPPIPSPCRKPGRS